MTQRFLTGARRFITDREPMAGRFLADPTAALPDDHARHLEAVLAADPRGFPWKELAR